MGCISSKTDINDVHPNIFQVMNVDELGNRLNPGQLEITETDLVLHQRRKTPIKWPLKCLRRYGFDAELFSFESGRRCPTGPGIYAFRCQRAEQLFNILQIYIQVRNNMGEDGLSREFSVPPASGPTISLRGSSSSDSNYLDPTPVRTCHVVPGNLRFISHNGIISTRLDSVGSSSNGPISPQGTASPSPPPVTVSNMCAVISSVSDSNPSVHYANEELFSSSTTATDPSENPNKEFLRQSLPSSVTMNSLSNDYFAKDYPVSRLSMCSGDSTGFSTLADPSKIPYVNVDFSAYPISPSLSSDGDANFSCSENYKYVQPLYMNVISGVDNGRITSVDTTIPLNAKSPNTRFGASLSPKIRMPRETTRCYKNLQPGEIDLLGNVPPKNLVRGSENIFHAANTTVSQSVHLGVSPINIPRQVNYVVLDLEHGKEGTSLNSFPSQPHHQASSGYPISLAVIHNSPDVSQISEGYATIDFDKTVALSHSANPSVGNDSEGSRKTRHNSTISDMPSPLVSHTSSD